MLDSIDAVMNACMVTVDTSHSLSILYHCGLLTLFLCMGEWSKVLAIARDVNGISQEMGHFWLMAHTRWNGHLQPNDIFIMLNDRRLGDGEGMFIRSLSCYHTPPVPQELTYDLALKRVKTMVRAINNLYPSAYTAEERKVHDLPDTSILVERSQTQTQTQPASGTSGAKGDEASQQIPDPNAQKAGEPAEDANRNVEEHLHEPNTDNDRGALQQVETQLSD